MVWNEYVQGQYNYKNPMLIKTYIFNLVPTMVSGITFIISIK